MEGVPAASTSLLSNEAAPSASVTLVSSSCSRIQFAVFLLYQNGHDCAASESSAPSASKPLHPRRFDLSSAGSRSKLLGHLYQGAVPFLGGWILALQEPSLKL